ncbi:Gfo/Idh/MocA family oxidoreductase [candidate division KSB1 bacterium]|nr:Gfo/Idh/MocA family oxidoreductase [candidate division KSB1 bacterium]
MKTLVNFKELKIGILGLGPQARRRHLPAFSEMGIIPTIVYDQNPDSVSKTEADFETIFGNKPFPGIAKDFDNFTDFIQVADVVVPPCEHLQIFSSLVEKGIMFISEKPFCRSWPEAVAVLELVKNANLAAGYLENWIFDPVVINLKSVMTSGEIGPIQRMTVRFPNAGPAIYPEQSEWRTRRDCGGALLDWGSHAVGLALHLAGEMSDIVQVSTIDFRSTSRMLASGIFQDGIVEDLAKFEIVLKQASNRIVIANIDCSWQMPWMYSPGYAYRVLQLDGSAGMVEITVENTENGRNYHMTVEQWSGNRRTVNLGLLKRFDPTASAIRNALKSLFIGSAPHPESSLELAVKVQFILAAVRLSAARNLPVTEKQVKDWFAVFTEKYNEPDIVWQKAVQSLKPESKQ